MLPSRRRERIVEESPARIALIVAADEPALFYASIDVAEQDLEAIDVRDGIYTAAYGPQGEPYEIGADGERVVITPAAGPARPDELKALVLRYLEAIGDPADPLEDLPQLLSRCVPSKAPKPFPRWGCLAVLAAAVAAVGYVLPTSATPVELEFEQVELSK